MSGLRLLAATLLAVILFALAPWPAQAAALQPPRAEEPAACATIPELQGSGNTSPCQGHRADIAGCITGVTATGFFFQDLAGDGDPATSDGIYAYYASSWTNPNSLKPGDRVSVSGTVTEYYGTTEFAHRSADPLQVTVTGACELPPPAGIQPYLDPWADPHTLYERTESMRVHMYFIGWVVGPTKRYSSRYPAGDPEIAVVDDRSLIPSRSRVFERDYPGYGGITYLNGGLGYDVRDLYFGDSIVGNVTGVLAYQYGKYTLLFDSPERIVWESQPLVRPAVPLLDPRRGAFDICYFNAENLFDHLNDGHGDWGDWAPGWPHAGTDAGEGGYRYKLLRIAACHRELAGRLRAGRAGGGRGQAAGLGRPGRRGDPARRQPLRPAHLGGPLRRVGRPPGHLAGLPDPGRRRPARRRLVARAGPALHRLGVRRRPRLRAHPGRRPVPLQRRPSRAGRRVGVQRALQVQGIQHFMRYRRLRGRPGAGGGRPARHPAASPQPRRVRDCRRRPQRHTRLQPDCHPRRRAWARRGAAHRALVRAAGRHPLQLHLQRREPGARPRLRHQPGGRPSTLAAPTLPHARGGGPPGARAGLRPRPAARDLLAAAGTRRRALSCRSSGSRIPVRRRRRRGGPPPTNTPTKPSPTTTISGCPTGPALSCSACP